MSKTWGTKKQSKTVYVAAKVQIGKSKIRVTPLDPESNERYECSRSKAPEDIQPGEWVVSMAEDGDTIYSIKPIEGMFKLKFTGFAKGEEEKIPVPKHTHYMYTDPKTQKQTAIDYDHFTATFEIIEVGGETDAKEVGMTLVKKLRYHFYDDEGNVGFDKARSKYTDELKDWLEVLGVFEEGEMKYSENILPELEERISREGRKFLGTVKDGFLSSIIVAKAPQKKQKAPTKQVEEEFEEEPEVVEEDLDELSDILSEPEDWDEEEFED